MNLNVSTFYLWLSIGLMPFLLLAVFRFVYRKKLAESMLRSLVNLPTASREKILSYEKKTAELLKLSLWPALMVTVGMILVAPEDWFSVLGGMVLLGTFIFLEYKIRKQLIEYLETQEILK